MTFFLHNITKGKNERHNAKYDFTAYYVTKWVVFVLDINCYIQRHEKKSIRSLQFFTIYFI
jgi:hypothetical protein